jgi:PAS domain S-box-containing protein
VEASQANAVEGGGSQTISENGGRVLRRVWRLGADGVPTTVLVVQPAGEHPAPAELERLAHEFGLKDALDPDWAVRPLAMEQALGRTMLVLEDPGGEPLDRLVGTSMPVDVFLRLAIGAASALRKAHECGFVHKDIKPANILANLVTGDVRLTGFGIASRRPREWPAIEEVKFVSGSLAYMAPEQTGRMNRTVDTRSDLYALGVTLYHMLTGSLPFTAADPAELMHGHIARKPPPPEERRTHTPPPISALIMRLLAKMPEERYQSAAGLEYDLQRCLAEWEAQGRIDDFVLGQNDRSDKLSIPEKLYGREGEIETLGAAFDRVKTDHTAELVLVSGYPGVGKSALVGELRKSFAAAGASFAGGKCDTSKRDIPYAALAHALRGLISPLLGKSDPELAPWREALRDALGSHGQPLVALMPELEPLIGSQPPAPELPPQEAQRRFFSVFCRLLGLFARTEHPLVLFLDDLQWLDPATLDLIEHLTTQSGLRNLLLIGAYRDNDVTASHPLMRRLAAIRGAGGQVREILLSPLTVDDLTRLIADTLDCASQAVAPLASLVHAKTGGNPFFAIQFLTALAEQRLLTFDYAAGRWIWRLDDIADKGFTDNVVELVLEKLHRLPRLTQINLQQLACLGDSVSVASLAAVGGEDEETLHRALLAAVQGGLLLRHDSAYRFPHDRVREAAYELIPPAERPAAHLAIARGLQTASAQEAGLFEIVGQFNLGAAHITSRDERERVAELNLMAGQRAEVAMAYTSALTHFEAGSALLPGDAWERRQSLAFELELHRAQCECWAGAWEAAETRLASLAERADDMVQHAAVAGLRLDLYINRGAAEQAVAVALEALRPAGIEWSAHPSPLEAAREYERIWQQLGARTIEELASLPQMQDQEDRAILVLLTKFGPAALYTDGNLFALTMCRGVNLTLVRGASDPAPVFYATVGLIASSAFGEPDVGYRLGQLACNMLEEGFDLIAGRTLVVFHRIVPWTRPVRESIEPARRAYRHCSEAGDFNYAGYACACLVVSLLAAGDPLVEVEREACHGVEFARSVGFDYAVGLMAPPLGLARTLRGETARFGCLDDGAFSESAFEAGLGDDPSFAIPAAFYWICKLQARLMAGEIGAAVEAAERAGDLLASSEAFSVYLLERANYHLYAALALAASAALAAPDEQRLRALHVHLLQLQDWAVACPANFEDRAMLVAAEVARLEDRPLDAERLYEAAIHAAGTNGFVHHEALSNEFAGRFYLARGLRTVAAAHLREARRCYLSWGAEEKVRQLERLYPQVWTEEPSANPSNTIAASVERLDLATVLSLSSAISREIVLENLINTLMRIALEHAGGERGLLVLFHDGVPRISAEAKSTGSGVVVERLSAPVTATVLPESILHYMQRTRDVVVLHDAMQSQFAGDPYVAQRKARSIMAVPLLTQGILVGALFLENELVSGAFAPRGIAVLKLLASQAAIALENTRLYAELAEREARIRRLVDANIVGVVVWGPNGELLEANDAFLEIGGYGREDLTSGHLRWQDLTPPEWMGAHETRWGPQFVASGSLPPYEQEYIRKDGSRAPVLIGAAAFERGHTEGVAFVLDLTDRKRAEARAREHERLLGETQAELAHANRVATISHLAGSIVHDLNQPLGAAMANAEAAIRWLSADPPNMTEAKIALVDIPASCQRAAEIIHGMRALVKKDPKRVGPVALNDVVAEIVALTRNEAEKSRITVQTEFAERLPPVDGDRVQLQQVILNLIVNAIQAMSEVEGRRELLITTAAIESGVVAAVEDTGPGFAAADAERLFESFYTTKASGLGLGLAICRSIAEAHEGSLSASTKAPRGARFELTLPATAHPRH